MATSDKPTIPSYDLPICVEGTNDANWYKTLVSIFNASGAAAGLNLTIVESTANSALLAAKSAEVAANTALVVANTAETTAVAAETAASTAITQSQQTQSQLGNFLVKANNLSDLTIPAAGRNNLGVSFWPFTVQFDTCSSGLIKVIPIGRGYQIPLNFAGSIIYAGTIPTNNASFTISYIRAGITSQIGTLGLVHGGNFLLTPVIGNATTLQAGDILTIQAPAVVDPTLSQVGIMIAASLS